jgi:hypothetical protein
MRSYVSPVDQIPPGMHRRRGTYRTGTSRRRGGPVRETIAHNPRRGRKASPSTSAPSAPQGRRNAGVGVGIVVLAVTIGFVTLAASLDSSAGGSGGSLSVQVKADLNQAVASLAALGFRNARSTSSRTPSTSYGTDCAASSTGEVRRYLGRHPCKEYASAMLAARSHGATAQVAISWVVMPSVALAAQYKSEADAPRNGNPPGESRAFNGRCHASGEDGATVWTEQVQPTGPLSVDAERQILRAAAPRKLTEGYLLRHCTG